MNRIGDDVDWVPTSYICLFLLLLFSSHTVRVLLANIFSPSFFPCPVCRTLSSSSSFVSFLHFVCTIFFYFFFFFFFISGLSTLWRFIYFAFSVFQHYTFHVSASTCLPTKTCLDFKFFYFFVFCFSFIFWLLFCYYFFPLFIPFLTHLGAVWAFVFTLYCTHC